MTTGTGNKKPFRMSFGTPPKNPPKGVWVEHVIKDGKLVPTGKVVKP